MHLLEEALKICQLASTMWQQLKYKCIIAILINKADFIQNFLALAVQMFSLDLYKIINS